MKNKKNIDNWYVCINTICKCSVCRRFNYRKKMYIMIILHFIKIKNVQDALDELYSKASNLTSCSKGVAEPVLKDGLIPVKLSDDGTVTYADTSKSMV